MRKGSELAGTPAVAYRWRNLLLPVLAGVAAGGCGPSAESAPVRVGGTVTFYGRPLAGGIIVFAPDADRGTSGKALAATVGPDGYFQLSGGGPVPPGWYRVAVADAPAADAAYSYRPRFPAALRRPDKSGLSREVRPGGDNFFDFVIDIPE